MEKVRVKTNTGIYEGMKDIYDVCHFLGISYAHIPGRWKKAEPLPKTEAIINATQYGSACWQEIWPEEYDEVPPMSEECLSLNIWVSDSEMAGKPVMVWIHGGANATGSNRMDCCRGIYCGDLFVKDNPDIIYVNINYRLNVFGSMDFSDIDIAGEYKDSNNLQVLDQIAALRWIYENIGFFGGDKENITVFGQSAGAYSISTLLMIPEATQYFKKAICQSCAVDESLKTKAQSVYIGRRFRELTGVSTMEECLKLTPEEILRTVPEIMKNPICPAFCATRDGQLIPKNIYRAFENGCASDITVMLGTTSGEYDTKCVDASEEEILAMAREAYFADVTDEMVNQYIHNEPDRDRRTALMDMFNDSMRLTVVALADALSSGGSDVYMYYIDCMDAGDKIRPQHCYEIPYLSGRKDVMVYMSNDVPEPVQGRTPSLERQRRFQENWTAFARNGIPVDQQTGTMWEKYAIVHPVTMLIGEEWKNVPSIRLKDKDTMWPSVRIDNNN